MSLRKLFSIRERDRISDSATISRKEAVDSNSRKPSEDVRAALTMLNSTAWTGFKTLLKVLHEAAGAFPPLDATVGGLVALIAVYDRTKSNYDWMEETMARLDRLCSILANRIENIGSTDNFGPSITALHNQLKKIERLHKRGWAVRAVTSTADEGLLRDMCRLIGDTIQELQLELGISLEKRVEVHFGNFALHGLPSSKTASYTASLRDGVSRRQCTDGTRVGVLKGILDWAHDPRPEVQPIFWISGLAGQGKTTIAYTACTQLEKQEKTASFCSFFCSSKLDSRGENLLVPTLVSQLARHSASFAREAAQVAHSYLDIGHQRLDVQMKQLLIGPWDKSVSFRENLLPTTIVIDAIDEHDVGAQFVALLLAALDAGSLKGMRWILTCRPDATFSGLFNSTETLIGRYAHRLDLSDPPTELEDTPEADILTYLRAELPRHRDQPYLMTLAEVSAGLFLYASTAVQLIKAGSRTRKSQREEKEQIMQFNSYSKQASCAAGERDGILDCIYAEVMSRAFEGLTPAQRDARLNVLLAFIITVQTTPIRLGVLAELSGPEVDLELADLTILSLRSVLYMEHQAESPFRSYPIICHHASFEDYILRTYGSVLRQTSWRIYCRCWNSIIPSRERGHNAYDCTERKPWNLGESELTSRDLSYAVKLSKLYMQISNPEVWPSVKNGCRRSINAKREDYLRFDAAAPVHSGPQPQAIFTVRSVKWDLGDDTRIECDMGHGITTR